MEVRAVDGELASPASPISTVAVAVNGKKNCKSAVKWALEKFAPGGRSLFKLLHIRARVTMVPTEMGNYIPISNVRDEVVSAYKKEIEWKTNAMFLPYKQMCTQKKVEAEAVVIESDDIADAISQEIAKFSIGTLVIGASSRSMLRRKLRGCDVSSRISECIPSFCTVYVISKGSLLSVRTSTSESERSYSNISSDSYFSSTSCLETGIELFYCVVCHLQAFCFDHCCYFPFINRLEKVVLRGKKCFVSSVDFPALSHWIIPSWKSEDPYFPTNGVLSWKENAPNGLSYRRVDVNGWSPLSHEKTHMHMQTHVHY